MASSNELLIKINGTAKDFLDEMDKVKKQTKDVQKVLTQVAKTSALAFAGLTATIAAVTKVYANYETALVGVGKTTNLTGKNLSKLGDEISALSSTIPISTNELLGMAQAGGQLGVAAEDLVKFTDTVARLGVATDLSGEQAATGLTRILTVTGEGIGNIDKFGSVIVQLGNNFAATESEIVHMTGRVAKATALFGVSSTEAAGMATALKAIGVEAQLGGSAMGRAFRAIDKTLRDGGEKLKTLEELTGLTGDKLKQVFEKDSTKAMQIFIESLGELEAAGGDVTGELAKFGLKGEQILQVLPVLAKNSEFFGRAIKTATDELKTNTALMNESEAAFDTLNSEAKLLTNEMTTFAREIGAQLAPQIRNLIGHSRELVQWLTNLDDETKDTIASVLKWAAIITGAVAAVATFAAGVVAAAGAFTLAQLALAPLLLAIGGMGAPIALAVAAVGGLAIAMNELLSGPSEDGLTKDLEGVVNELEEARKKQKELNDILKDKTAIEINHSAFLGAKQKELKVLDEEIAKLEELAKTAKATNEEFGTGAILTRPDVEGPKDLDLSLPTIADQVVNAPLALDQDTRAQEAQAAESLRLAVEAEKAKGEAVKTAREEAEQDKKTKAAQAKQDAINVEKEKLDTLKEGQAAIAAERAIFDAETKDGASKKELALLAKKQEFNAKVRESNRETAAAESLTNEEQKKLAVQNAADKNLLLLEQQALFIDQAKIQKEEEVERNATFDEELRAIDEERTAALNAKDLKTLQEKVKTERDVERGEAVNKVTREIKARNQEIEDTKKYGVVIAKLNRFFGSEEIDHAKNTANSLSALANSENSKLKAIGKAAAHTRAAIATAEGAIKAYTSLAGIPIVGSVLGIAAAGALTAYGIEQQARISSAQRGGIVQDVAGGAGARDRVPALLEPGELVVPKALTPDFIQSVGRPEVSAEGGANNVSVEIGLTNEFLEFVEDGLEERRALNISSEGIS